MQANISISAKNPESSINLLSFLLADEILTLYIKTRKFHWDASGDSFMECYNLNEKRHKQLEETIAEVPKRTGKIGQWAIGNTQEFLSLDSINTKNQQNLPSTNTPQELLPDQEKIIINLRKGLDQCLELYKDAEHADFLTGLLDQHETMAWALRRYLK
jgi:starvation-inducible DNA-binding protein